MIRQAELSDIPVLLEIERASFTGPVQWDEESLRYEVGRSRVFVWEAQGFVRPILGYACLSVKAHRGRLESVAVLPDTRKQGIGSDLITYVIGKVRDKGATHCDLECDTALVSFYMKFGFVVYGYYKGWYDDGSDGVLMRKDLQTETPLPMKPKPFGLEKSS